MKVDLGRLDVVVGPAQGKVDSGEPEFEPRPVESHSNAAGLANVVRQRIVRTLAHGPKVHPSLKIIARADSPYSMELC